MFCPLPTKPTLKMSDRIQKPNAGLFWTEPFRALSGFGPYFRYRSKLMELPKGDGHPVMVIPGFMGSGLSTHILRKFINKHGYHAYDWGLDRNLANFKDLDFLSLKINDLYRKHQKKVSLIGWSLGGVYARQLAKQNPTQVRQVITMGSPFAKITAPNNAKWLYDWIKKREGTPEAEEAVMNDLPNPTPVPTTSIYSKQDGIVPWQSCIELHEDETHQNVEIIGSHLGLGWNPSAMKIIVDRLSYEASNWRPY